MHKQKEEWTAHYLFRMNLFIVSVAPFCALILPMASVKLLTVILCTTVLSAHCQVA